MTTVCIIFCYFPDIVPDLLNVTPCEDDGDHLLCNSARKQVTSKQKAWPLPTE